MHECRQHEAGEFEGHPHVAQRCRGGRISESSLVPSSTFGFFDFGTFGICQLLTLLSKVNSVASWTHRVPLQRGRDVDIQREAHWGPRKHHSRS